MTKPITQAFWDAIGAAGLHGLPFTADFDAGGNLIQDADTGHNMSVTPQQVSAIEAVYATWLAAQTPLLVAQEAAQLALASIAGTALNANITNASLIAGKTLLNNYGPQWSGVILGAMIAAQAAEAAGNSSYTTPWQDQNGAFFSLTAAQTVSLAQEAIAYVQAVYANQSALSVEIASASSPTAVAAINLNGGWPATSY